MSCLGLHKQLVNLAGCVLDFIIFVINSFTAALFIILRYACIFSSFIQPTLSLVA